MSKLAKAITATFTGDVVAKRNLGLKYTDIDMALSVDREIPARIYRVEARLGVRRIVNTSNSIDSDLINEHTLKAIKQAIIEEVFGEFRPLINDTRLAIYQDDRHKACQLIDDLYEQMYHEI